MPTPERRQFNLETLRSLALPVLCMTIGLQVLRVLYPSLAWYVSDTLGAGSASLAVYAFACFLPAFLAASLRRLAGPRFSLGILAGGLAAIRVAEQLATRPSTDLWLGLVGAAFFVLFLPTWIGHVRARGGPHSTLLLAYAPILGLALDSAVKGAAGTLDLSWSAGPAPLLVVLAMAILAILFLALEPTPSTDAPLEAGWAEAVPLLALGPYLLVQALIFQNQGWIAEVAHLGMSAAFAMVMAGNMAAAIGVAAGFSSAFRHRLGLSFGAALLVGLTALVAARESSSFPLVLLLAQAAVGWGWGLSALLLAQATRPSLVRTTVICGLSMILYLLLSFLYYASFDIALPVPRAAMIPTAFAILGLAFVYTAVRIAKERLAPRHDAVPLVLAGALALVPLLLWAMAPQEPAAEAPRGLPVRVMTYNIHSAYTSEGRQDPEAIAGVIEASGADIVALQEVSRGWVIDGTTDLPAWLSRRLDMPFIFRGTADPVWGNAILSRFPIVEYGWGPLPLAGTILPRGYLWAQVDIGETRPLLVIATHLHHIESEHEPRMAQVSTLLEFWNGRPFSLLLGDLNSEPHYPEMGLLLRAGLADSWQEAGEGEGLTWPAVDPFERIDWIWHTPDLSAVRARVILSTASDHLPVIVILDAAGSQH